MRISKPVVAGVALALLVGSGFGMSILVEEVQEARIEHAMVQGGYVIYLRHADRFSGSKEPYTATTPLADFSDCSKQRDLTAAGRGEAARIGRAFRTLGVPIGQVYALPLCRTRKTAELAFGRAVLDAELYDTRFVAAKLAEAPAMGSNTVLVDTEDQVRRVAGIDLLPGEAAVFQPDGRGGTRYRGMLDQDDLIR